jgi:tetratricopeptide (TPR) repeat protein
VSENYSRHKMNFANNTSLKKPLIKVHRNSSEKELGSFSLESICKQVISGKTPYDDLAELIEDKAYEHCEKEELDNAILHLSSIALFFESLENKNEEISRNLADVYLLIGQIYQFAGRFDESIAWFSRSIVVDDQYPVPYHNLSISYNKAGKIDSAIRSLEQEILLAPGNYYSYLLLSDIYESNNMTLEFEHCLKQLLERDPDNIQGLHRLIRHYEKHDKSTDSSLLCKRILGINKVFNKSELLIKSYYLCREKRFHETCKLLDKYQTSSDQTTIIHLINAHIFSVERKFSLRKKELGIFIQKNDRKRDVIETKIQEFGAIFGNTPSQRLAKTILLLVDSAS